MKTADFVLGDIIRVRVAGERTDLAAVERQLGFAPEPPAGEPDLRIDFEASVAVDGDVRFLGRDEFGYSESQFIVRVGKGKQPTFVVLPLETLGHRPTIVSRSGSGPVPLLISMIAVTALAKGFVPLHAGAFEQDGSGVLVVGWSKGGKTETLLAASRAGARYVGDEWCYVADDGTVTGVPEPVTLWPWHLDERPDLRRHASRSDRLRARAFDLPERIDQRLFAQRDRGGRTKLGSLSRKLAWHSRSRASVWVPPGDLFGVDGVSTTHLDRLILATSWDRPDTVVEPRSGLDVAQRMVSSVLFELRPLLDAYTMYRYAFPGLHNELLDAVPELLNNGITRVLENIDAYELSHPYPVSFDDLESALNSMSMGSAK